MQRQKATQFFLRLIVAQECRVELALEEKVRGILWIKAAELLFQREVVTRQVNVVQLLGGPGAGGRRICRVDTAGICTEDGEMQQREGKFHEKKKGVRSSY